MVSRFYIKSAIAQMVAKGKRQKAKGKRQKAKGRHSFVDPRLG
jgi:hypothetical protein